MEDINKFIGGMNSDVHPSMQPDNTIRHCLNFVPLSESGNIYAITNESGTTITQTTFPTGFKVNGYSVLERDIIVILVNTSNHVLIGYIREDNVPDATYGNLHLIGPVDSNGDVVLNNTEFGFTLDYPIACVSRKMINGNRMLYYTDNNVPFGVIDLDNPPVVGSINTTSQLAFNFNIPTINIVEVIENRSSTITPGVVQFITRYVSSKGDITNFGIPSKPLPMVIAPKAGGANAFEGNYYNDGIVPKNIKIQITDLDQNYNELEIIAIYYEQVTATFKSSIVGRLPIQGSSLNFTYTGPDTENLIDLTLDELRKQNVSYTKAKCIAQKDNTLFLSNLKTSYRDNNSELQLIANKVKVYYQIEEILFSNRGDSENPSFTDYVDEIQCLEKGYRRGEVYSLGFYLIYNDGTQSPTYHIPGEKSYLINDASIGKKKNSSWPNYGTGTTSYKLGCYVSTLEYPTDSNYPGNRVGDDDTEDGPTGFESNIRHHYMPELYNEPHFRKSGDDTYVRKLGLKYVFTEAIPDDILRDVCDIVFVRELRDSTKKKSVLAQGFANRMMITADDFDDDGQVAGDVFNEFREGYCATEVPAFGNLYSVNFTGDATTSTGGARKNVGMALPVFTNSGITGTYEDGRLLDTALLSRQCIFHSPESDLVFSNALTESLVSGGSLKPVMELTGTYDVIDWKADKYIRKDIGFQKVGVGLQNYMYYDFFANFNDYIVNSFIKDATVSDITYNRILSPGIFRAPALDVAARPGLKTTSRWNNGGLEIVTDVNLYSENLPNFIFKNQYPENPANDSTGGYVYNDDVDDSVPIEPGTINRVLRNLTRTIDDQYENVDNAEYYVTDRRSPVSNGTYENIYGGDTFITKYAFNTGNLVPYFPYNEVEQSGARSSAVNDPYNENSEVQSITYDDRNYFQKDGIIMGSTLGKADVAAGWDVRSTTYYFVESDVNTYYRHVPSDDTERKYFPNTMDKITLLKTYLPYEGSINQVYNDVFSFEDKVKANFPKATGTQVLSKFETRTIYSESAANDDVSDNYRNLLQNNYYDLPANTGPIWNSFVMLNQLFLHTPKSLWKTFAEPAATLQGGNVSDIVLGTSALFARPSQELFTSSGGYGGTISQFAGVHSPVGYVFPDVLQGKIFVIGAGKSGMALKEISQDGISTYCHKNMGTGLIQTGTTFSFKNINTDNAHLIDNPFKGIGYTGGFDHKLKRAWITKLGEFGFTLSYSIILQKWFSFHSYKPNAIIAYDNRVFFIQNGTTSILWEMNTGAKGVFMDSATTPVPVESSMTISSAKEILSGKTYQNLNISSYSSNNGLKIRDDNFSTMQVYNDKVNSGTYNLIPGNTFAPTKYSGETFYKYRNGEYSIAIPRDSVIDNAENLFLPNNLDNTQLFKERIKGNYAIFVFNYNNSYNYEFFLRYIMTIFNKNIR